MSCINHHLQLSCIKTMQEEWELVHKQFATREISIGEFLKRKDSIRTNINNLLTYFDIHESELYKLGAVLRERLNLQEVRKFEHGYAKATEPNWDSVEFYIDTKGNRVIKPEKVITIAINKYQTQIVVKNGKLHFIKEDGTKLNGEEYDEGYDFSNGRAAVKVGNKWHFIKEDGSKLDDKEYVDTTSFSNGRAQVLVGNNYTFIDINGKKIEIRSKYK